MSRRTFLEGLLSAALAAVATPFLTSCGRLLRSSSPPQEAAPDTRFGGDDFSICHAVRDGASFPGARSTRRCDVVVVGGGVSGLSAAWHLRDYDVLLLEKDPKPGGTARRESWRGQPYALGAAYFTEPNGPFGAMLQELRLTPRKIQQPANSLFWEGKVYPDILREGVRDLPFDKGVVRSFEEAWAAMKALRNDEERLPTTPIEETPGKSLEFDTMTFAGYLSRFHPKVTEFLNLYVRSSWGVDSSAISAFAGLNFFPSEFEPLYSFPGGNAEVAETLAQVLGNRVLTGAFVSEIEPTDRGVRVSYRKDRRSFAIEAAAAVVATPKQITTRILPSLPRGHRELFQEMRYGSYLVGAALCRAPLYRGSYELWCFDKIFTDIIPADWVDRGNGRGGNIREGVRTHPSDGFPPPSPQVLSLYMPMGEHEGRRRLLSLSFDETVARIRRDLISIFPEAEQQVEEIRLFRWGHPMLIAPPGFISTKLLPAPKQWGRVAFAHSDMQGVPSIDAAYYAGSRAARAIRHLLTGRPIPTH